MKYNLLILSKAIRQHSNCSNGMPYNGAIVQWLYTLKALICLLLGREGNPRADYPVVIAWIDGGTSWSSEQATMYWGEYFCTGYGLRCGRWYAVDQVSS